MCRTHGIASFEQAVGSDGIAPTASPFQRGIVACTGSEFCKLALVETKAFSLNLIPDLERRLPNFSQHLRIHVTGCPNACGQHWIADIGLQGVQVEDNGQQVDGFDLFVGGGLGRAADFAHRVNVRLPATRVAGALETLLRAYLATREEGDVFRTWTARVTDATIKELLAAA